MSALLDAIGAFLTTEDIVGGSTGWAVHKLSAQDTPDQTVTIYETGGQAPEQATDRRWAMPTFQVVARSKVQATAEAKAQAIFEALDRAEVNGFAYLTAQQSTPVALGPDVGGRYRFALNFRGGVV